MHAQEHGIVATRMTISPKLVVFSDVDGVLADPANASVASAVSLLARERVPLVLCSSRTRAEIEHIAKALGSRHPFVCEHGDALFVPRGYFPFEVPNAREVAGYDAIEFGRSYGAVVEALGRAAARTSVKVRGFNDMSVEEVAEECGLPLLTARLAKLRDYGEFFRVIDARPGAVDRLFLALEAARLRCIAGPRYHFVGGAADISLGMSTLCTMYERAFSAVRFAAVTHGGVDAPARVLRQTVVVHADSTADWARVVTDIAGSFRRRTDAPAPAVGEVSRCS